MPQSVTSGKAYWPIGRQFNDIAALIFNCPAHSPNSESFLGGTMKDRLKQLLKEPLVHFLGAGLVIFILLGGTGNAVDPESRKITIDEAKVEQLAARFAGIWRRAPNEQEIDGLIRDYIREEIYYREARRIGLNENDPIIRRRLRSKMEEIATASAQSAEPEDAALQAAIDADPAKYSDGGQTTFSQIWIGEDGDAATALKNIQNGTDPATLGKQISLPFAMKAASRIQIDRSFGEGFTKRLSKIKIGTWSGPVISGFGTHLVRVEKYVAGKTPALADIRQQVENDWRAKNTAQRKEEAYQALLDGYEIEIEKPE